MAICQTCGNENHVDNAKFCQECGVEVSANYCTSPNCEKYNSNIPNNAIYCPFCGEESYYHQTGVNK